MNETLRYDVPDESRTTIILTIDGHECAMSVIDWLDLQADVNSVMSKEYITSERALSSGNMFHVKLAEEEPIPTQDIP